MTSIEALQHAGQQAFHSNDLEKAAACFEQLLEQQPDVLQHYLFLGLTYLLMEQEEAAQLAWATAFSEIDESGEENLLAELIQMLQAKILEFEQQENWDIVNLLYQYLHEF